MSKKRTQNSEIKVPERTLPDNGLKEFMESLKNSGFESLKKQAEDWETTYNPQPSSEGLDRQEKLNYFLQDFKGTLGPLIDVVNFVEQRKQSKDASRIADESIRQAPTAPSVRGENRMLSNLIRNSQIAYSNPQQFLQPYADQTNLAYNQDIARAQELSGGQSGTALGLGQAAAIRRDQSNLSTAPMASKIAQEGIGVTGALIGQQMQDDTWRDQQNIDLYKTANANNQELQRQAGLGLAMSRAREIQARNNALDSMLNSPVFDVNTYMNYTRDNLVNPPRI